MTRGRKPKPTHLKVVEGNPGRRPLNTKEPKPKGNLYDCPEHLNADQRKVWKYAIECAPHGLLKRVDRSVLLAWVVAEDLHRQATEKLNEHSLLISTPNGMPVQTPYISIINKQAAIMVKAASEMGFTPASRSRVEVDEPEEGNEFFTR
ncbi:phage terminase small subunit P27 family [Sphingomicrobium sp. XHP0239]|uniref:phage terminase small subunit P27 family n=1 Tax=Sphingomicrobium maritimum TaxID=3133972 RepID=UPI0031CC9043